MYCNSLKQDKKMPAHNERFCVIAAVSPQIMQCKLASYYPAGSSVEAATTQSRHHVIGKRRTARADTEAKNWTDKLILVVIINDKQR